MSRQKIVNTFGGLDTDTSLNKYSNERYTSCQNFRILHNEQNSSHALVNVRGNREMVKFIGQGNTRANIQGIGEFQDTLVLFVEIPLARNTVSIFEIPKQDITDRQFPLFINVSTNNPSYIKLSNKTFRLQGKITVITKEESTTIRKIYFTDEGTQPVRMVNLADPTVDSLPLNRFELVPSVDSADISTTLTQGSLKVGKVGYAYQLYNPYGSESNFSGVSRLTTLFSSPINNPRQIVGNDAGENSNKGVLVTINNLDETFERIRLVRIHYEDFNLEPSIEVIDESPFDGEYTYTDVGLPGLDTYAVEEFNQLLINPSPKSIEVKNNYLFLANVKEDIFDVNYNATSNVDIEPHVIDITIDNANFVNGVTPISGIASYEWGAERTHYSTDIRLGFQRDELYRFGIVLYDDKMRPSFVKFIKDYRVNDDNISDRGTGTIIAKTMKLKFIVRSLPSSVTAYQIVMVPRTRERRSVLDMGITMPLASDSATQPMEFRSYSNIPFSSRIVEYTSPEILYNKLDEQGTTLQKVNTISMSNAELLNKDVVDVSGQKFNLRKFNAFTNNIKVNKRIEDFTIFNYSTDYRGNTPFRDRVVTNLLRRTENKGLDNSGSGDYRDIKGTTGILFLPDFAESAWTPNKANAALCRRRKNFIQQSGGTGDIIDFYGNLEANEFIPCAPISRRGQTNEVVASGDTYIEMFEFGRGFYNRSDKNFAQFISFPCETTIDLRLRGNPTISTLLPFNYLGASGVSLEDTVLVGSYQNIQEVKGVYDYHEGEYNQDFDLYTYNATYSRLNNVKRFFTAPEDVVFEQTFPTRVYYSDKKSNGEFTDSWTKIRPNNNMDLDSRYGEITSLYNFKDTLFVFQPKAVAALPVEQRELVQTNTPGPLVAGIGDVLSNPYYLSTESGASTKESITNSLRAIYYYDFLNNKICRVEENVNFISDTLKISSLLKKLKSGISAKDVVLGFDRNYNEVLLSFKNKDVLAFNEYIDTFTGTYTYEFDKFYNHKDLLYVIRDNEIYQTNTNLYGRYDGTYNDSEITLVMNPASNIQVIYDVLELTFEIFKNGQLLSEEPIHSIRLYNEYQDTGEIILKDFEQAVQRFRTWRVNTLVDKGEEEARLRSSYLYLDIVFKNKDDKKVVLHDIITNVRNTKMR